MRKLFYLGLESYECRYTASLEKYTRKAFEKRGIDYEVIYGNTLKTDEPIVTGSVLDAHGRTYYSLTQVANLVLKMKQGEITSDDVIFFEDMYTSGIDSLFYILDQVPAKYKPKIYVRQYAGQTDPDDFVNRTGMASWMSLHEKLVESKVNGVFVANEEFVAHLRIGGYKGSIYVTGLPVSKEDVLSRATPIPMLSRKNRVAFASRWDSEKQPNFYMDVAKEYYKIDPTVEFAVFTGHKKLKSNDENFVKQAYDLVNSKEANFKVYDGLTREEYYKQLADTRVLFSNAIQEWQSFITMDASALGTILLYPAYRSFPEVLANNEKFMYIPWSRNSAITQLQKMLNNPLDYDMTLMVNYWDGALDRHIDIFEGKGEQYSRNTLDYRKYLTIPKFAW